jgi:osmoprotectant transport system permease protein
VFQALERGEIDCYVEYTGTLSAEILRNDAAAAPERLSATLAARGIAAGPELGFDNTYGLAIERVLAERLGIRTIGDLVARADEPAIAALEFAFSDEFVRRADGWPAVRAAYGLRQTSRVVDHALASTGIDARSIQVTDLYATDPEPRLHDLVLLEDDRRAFREYRALILTRANLHERAPAVAAALAELAGTIDGPTMVGMNTAVRVNKQGEAEVATAFLHERPGRDVAPVAADGFCRLVHDILRATDQHLLLVFVSLAAAVVVGVPAGILAERHPAAGRWILGAAGIIQTIPSMAVLVFMVPLLGWRPAALALFLYRLLPIVRGTATGLASIPGHLREAALGLAPWERLRLVELPMASRSILAGIKTAAVINVGTATIGGLIGAGGYGAAILSGIRLADAARLMEGAIPAALLALGLEHGFDRLERWLVPAGLRTVGH